MSLTSMFKTNPDLEQKGFCVEYGPHEKTGEEIKIYLAFAGKTNSKYQKAIRRLTKPVERLIQNDSLSDEKSEAIYKEAFAESCVTGWSGVYESDLGLPQTATKKGEISEEVPAAFNKENVLALFENLPHLYDDLVLKAGKISNFKANALEEDSKN